MTPPSESQNIWEARDILGPAVRQLSSAGIDGAALDSRLLLAAAIGRDEAVLPHETLAGFDAAAADRFAAYLDRRVGGEPVSRIRGWREFWSLRFDLSPATLDPRADSETLVMAALEEVGAQADRPLRLLDLGCGTGALLLACLSELNAATGCGIDIDPVAVDTACRNADRLEFGKRASFLQGDLLIQRPVAPALIWCCATRPIFRRPRSRSWRPKWLCSIRTGPLMAGMTV